MRAAQPALLLFALLSLAAPAATQAPGERIQIDGASRLFLPAHLPRMGEPLDVVVHMHGSHALAQDAFYSTWRRAALVTVHIDGFSSVYTGYFRDPQALPRLLDRVEAALQSRRPTPGQSLVAQLALSAFSAGYAGVREVLAVPALASRVDAVLLGDGLHTSYVNGNRVNPAQMTGFVALARDAVAGSKDFRFSHSAIVPGTYASTTECADYLIATLGLARTPWPGVNPLGMVQAWRTERGTCAVHGFDGDQASDHVRHFRYLWWMLLDTRVGRAPSPLPLIDRFTAKGRDLAVWQTKFAPHAVRPVAPAAPGGDGYALVVQDPNGGYDTERIGPLDATDYAVEAQIYCDYRPELSANGFERVGIFARDDGNGTFDDTGGGSCYALTWDSGDGRVRCSRVLRGAATDLLSSPVLRPTTAWRRLRIEARGTALRFLVDGQTVLQTIDATLPRGQAGIGHHEWFTDNRLARGTRAEAFALTTLAGDDDKR
ncbi:MAG: hypothetical protein R3F56_20890 [Planctomycetota bacterium]